MNRIGPTGTAACHAVKSMTAERDMSSNKMHMALLFIIRKKIVL